MDSKEAVLKPSPKPEIESFLKAVARAPQSLLSSITTAPLPPFRKNRDHAVPYPGISALVAGDHALRARTRIAVISGRDANELFLSLDVHPRPNLGAAWVCSDSFGWKLRTFSARMKHRVCVVRRKIGCTPRLARRRRKFQTGSIAVPLARPFKRTPMLRPLCQRVCSGGKPIARHMNLHLLEFDGGVEIRAADVDKGDAVRTILCEMSPALPPCISAMTTQTSTPLRP